MVTVAINIEPEITGKASSCYTLETIQRALKIERAKATPDPEALALLERLWNDLESPKS